MCFLAHKPAHITYWQWLIIVSSSQFCCSVILWPWANLHLFVFHLAFIEWNHFWEPFCLCSSEVLYSLVTHTLHYYLLLFYFWTIRARARGNCPQKTQLCPHCRIVRQKCKASNFFHVYCIFSFLNLIQKRIEDF